MLALPGGGSLRLRAHYHVDHLGKVRSRVPALSLTTVPPLHWAVRGMMGP